MKAGALSFISGLGRIGVSLLGCGLGAFPPDHLARAVGGAVHCRHCIELNDLHTALEVWAARNQPRRRSMHTDNVGVAQVETVGAVRQLPVAGNGNDPAWRFG